jgi:aspartyl-tRNA(Asn)/glutamyl-tRNA(Gln) amidotransferase subunit C
MAESSEIEVGYVAKLARINLTEREAKLFQKQLDDVLKYVQKLREVDVSGVDVNAHPLAAFNVFRDDVPRDSFTAEQALRNAPRQANGLFVVPRVVE